MKDFGKRAAEYVAALEGDLDHPPINYCENRGIPKSILLDFGVGWAGWANAISLPHYDASGNVIGIRLRYVGTDKTQSRYGAHRGARMGLFGILQLRGRSTLILTEGEFNAMAIAAVRGNISYDVLSFGSEATIPDELIDLAAKYKRVVLLVDNDECAKRIREKLNHPSVGVFLSPEIDGIKFDANALLLRKGPDILVDIICTTMLGVDPLSLPELQVDCAPLLHVRSLQAAAKALTSFRIPGKMFEQSRLLRRSSDASAADESLKMLVGNLLGELLLYEDPQARATLRDEICKNLEIHPSLVRLPKPLMYPPNADGALYMCSLL